MILLKLRDSLMIVVHVSGAALADHLHDVPAAPAGAVVRADAVPGRLHQGGARHEAGAHGGQGPGENLCQESDEGFIYII